MAIGPSHGLMDQVHVLGPHHFKEDIIMSNQKKASQNHQQKGNSPKRQNQSPKEFLKERLIRTARKALVSLAQDLAGDFFDAAIRALRS